MPGCIAASRLLRRFFVNPAGISAPVFLILALPSLAVAGDIPPELQGEPWRQITAQIEASRHELRQVDGVWQARTPAQDYVTEFTDAGPVFRLDDGEVTHEIGLLLDSIDDDRPVERLALPLPAASSDSMAERSGFPQRSAEVKARAWRDIRAGLEEPQRLPEYCGARSFQLKRLLQRPEWVPLSYAHDMLLVHKERNQ